MAMTPDRPAMMPPFDSVVRSPPNGVEMSAQMPSATCSSEPNGSVATTAPSDVRAHAVRSASGATAAARAR